MMCSRSTPIPSPPHPADEDLDELVAGLGLGLVKQTQQQRLPSAGLADITQIASFQGHSLGGELPDLGVRNLAEERPGIENGIQLGESVDSQTQVLQVC